MKICHYDFSKPFDIGNGVGVLVVENANKFVRYCNDFVAQQNGEDGCFIFDDGDKAFSFKKNGCILFDFFGLSLCDKKIISGLYDQMKSVVDDEYLQEYYELRGRMSEFCDMLSVDSPIAVEYDADLCVQDFLKTMKVKPIDNKNSFAENILDYLDAQSRFAGTKLYVLVNLLSFLDDKDYALLMTHFAYAPYSVLLLERKQCDRVDNEPMLIIDNDLCEIVAQ